MRSFKILYGILLFGLLFYFLIYSLMLRKLPLVRIYVEYETQSDVTIRPHVDYKSSSGAFQVATERVPSSHDVTSREQNMQNVVDGSRKEKQDLTGEILSFLEGLGVPVGKADISPANIPTALPPRVNPNGASLPMLMKKVDNFFNLSEDKPCPAGHLRKVGLLAVNNNTVKLEDVQRELYFVDKGGQWTPGCRPRQQVGIVVPFRDRDTHLNIFLRHIHQFLRWQLLHYRIFIVKQADGEAFNRGMLMNVGFSEATKVANFSCFIFHDVDLLPEDARNDYSCPSSPRHMSTAVNKMDYRLKYKTLFGGVEGFWREHFRKVNGFPNRFWGWGGEDDDLYVRITERQLSLTRPAQMIGRYTMLHHVHDDRDANPQRYEELKVSGASIDTDGLNTLTYKVLEYQELPLYTMISVSLR